jgi:hypothetical protein
MAVGLKKMGKPSPVKFWQVAAIQAGASILGGLIGGRRRRREQRDAREAMQTSREAYMQQEYVNPYANLENPYEDLTINQQQAQFQAQQGAQQRADILEGLRGTAGGAGVAGLAQAMAGQAALGTQRISASIGQQEARNQELRARGAMGVQRLEGYGEQIRSQREQQRMETLYGMDMGRLTAANQARQQARQNMISGLGKAAGSLAGGMAREGMFSGGTGGPGGGPGGEIIGQREKAFDTYEEYQKYYGTGNGGDIGDFPINKPYDDEFSDDPWEYDSTFGQGGVWS